MTAEATEYRVTAPYIPRSHALDFESPKSCMSVDRFLLITTIVTGIVGLTGFLLGHYAVVNATVSVSMLVSGSFVMLASAIALILRNSCESPLEAIKNPAIEREEIEQLLEGCVRGSLMQLVSSLARMPSQEGEKMTPFEKIEVVLKKSELRLEENEGGHFPLFVYSIVVTSLASTSDTFEQLTSKYKNEELYRKVAFHLVDKPCYLSDEEGSFQNVGRLRMLCDTYPTLLEYEFNFGEKQETLRSIVDIRHFQYERLRDERTLNYYRAVRAALPRPPWE